MSSLSSWSPGDGTTPTSSARNRRNSSYARSDSTGRPARASASINRARRRSRNGSTAISASSSPMTSSGRPNSNSAAARSSIARARSSTSRATSAVANSSLANSAYGEPRHNPSASSNTPQRDLGSVGRPEPNPHQLLETQRVDLAARHPQPISRRACLEAVVTERARAAATTRSGACASRSAAGRHPTARRRDDHSRPPRWRGPPAPRASGAAARFPAAPARRRGRPPADPSTHSGVATRSSTGPPTPPTLRTQLRSSCARRRDHAARPLPHSVVEEPILAQAGLEADRIVGAVGAAERHGRRQPKEEVMAELQSPQRKSYTAKAIFGLLLAVVMVAAFATAGSALSPERTTPRHEGVL